MSITIGLDPNRVTANPEFGVGQFGSSDENEYIYVKASSAFGATGEVAVIDNDNEVAPLTTANDSVGRRISVTPSAVAQNHYFWALRRGDTEFLAGANCAANATLRATTVGGVVDDGGSGPAIEGLVATEAAGSMQTLVSGRATYPTLQEQAAGGGGGGASDFLSLDDTPSAFGTAGQVAAVNTAETALEFVDQSGGGGGGGTDDQTAAEVDVDTANFSQNLTSADDTVQAALETIDSFSQYQGTWQQASWPAGVIVTRSGIAYISLVNSNTEIPTPASTQWAGLTEGFTYRGEAPVVATNYNYGHVVKNPDTGSYYYFTSTISASVARADIPTHANFQVIAAETGGGGGGGGEAFQRVDSLVFTAVGSTTTQSVQQTLAATGFLVEDYESGGDSPVTAVASETTFMMAAGVYLLEWEATITNSGQRAAPTLDVQDDSDDSVIGSVEFHYIRYANTSVRYTFQGLLVVAADDTVCKAIVYNKTEDEAFTVAAGHKLRIVSLAGGGGTGGQQSGAFSISDVEVITDTTATTEYGLGTTWLNVVDALSPTFDPIDPDDILWVSIGLRVDAAAGPRILIMGSDIRQMNHTNDPLPSDLVNADEVPGAYYSARVARNNEDRVVEINPTLGWMEDRRMAGRYGVLFAFGENPAGNIASIRPFVSAAVEIDIEYITITVKGS